MLLNREARLPVAGDFAVARVPASRIARDHGILSPEGRPLGNLAVLGAAVKLLLPDGLELLEQAIGTRTGARAAANVSAARDGFAHCTRQHGLVGDVPVVHVPVPELRRTAALFPVSTTDSLSNLTGAWALEHPVLSETCSACALCALFCPEGVVSRADGVLAIDARYCKGCGICVEVCPVADAIRMEEVPA